MSRYDDWAAHLDPDMPDGILDDDEYEALDRISQVLSDEVVWDGPPPALRDRLLAEARAEIAVKEEAAVRDFFADDEIVIEDDPVVVSIDSASAGRTTAARTKARARWLLPAMTAAAAVVAIVAFISWPRSDLATYQLAGTELAPDASATVEVEPLGAGVAFTLNIVGLGPAGEGEYYAGWLSGEDGAVPIGSFHWREGGIPIELWSGVDIERYPNLAITLQQEGEPTVTSGVAVLKGQLVDELP